MRLRRPRVGRWAHERARGWAWWARIGQAGGGQGAGAPITKMLSAESTRRKRSEECTSGAQAPPPPRACCERLRRPRFKRSFKRGTAQVSTRHQQPLIEGTWWDVWKCNFSDRWVAWWGSHVPAGGAGSESDDVGVARPPPLPYIHILAGCPLFMLNPSFLRRCAPTV